MAITSPRGPCQSDDRSVGIAQHPKAVECLIKDRDVLLAFYARAAPGRQAPFHTLPQYDVHLAEVHALPGQRVNVPISVVDGAGLYAGGLRVAYDASVLRAVDAVPCGLLSGSYWQANTGRVGEVSCAFVRMDPLAAGGELFTLASEVLSEAEDLTTSLTLADAQFNDGLHVVCHAGSISTLPVAARLLPGFPNPFNPETTLRYTVPAAGYVYLSVHNSAGQLVRWLVDGQRSAGSHYAVWDGCGGDGRELASGVYVCRLRAGASSVGRKIMLLR